MKEESKKNISYIMPKHGYLFTYIKNAGFTINDPYYGKGIIFRILREIHFRFNLPFKSIWFNKINKKCAPIIFSSASLIIPEYLEWLRNHNNNSRIILLYLNPVSISIKPETIKDDLCEKWSGDPYDCAKYGMNYIRGGCYFKDWKVVKQNPEFDVFFVGKDKGRLMQLQELQKYFDNLGLITYFHIVAERKYSLKQNKLYKPFMPYEQVLEMLGKSKAILHLVEGGQTGITIRVQESLIHEIKLITDCKELKSYDFFNPNNIFILGEDDINQLPHFLELPYIPVQSTAFNHIYFEDMISEIISGSTGDVVC